MPTRKLTVRCNPDSKENGYKTKIYDEQQKEIPEWISVTKQTDFVLTADDTDAPVRAQGFVLYVDPNQEDQVSNILGQESRVITFTDLCNRPCDLSMNLGARLPRNPIPVVAGAKPAIRNSPAKGVSSDGLKFRFIWGAIALEALAVLVMAVYLYLHAHA